MVVEYVNINDMMNQMWFILFFSICLPRTFQTVLIPNELFLGSKTKSTTQFSAGISNAEGAKIYILGKSENKPNITKQKEIIETSTKKKGYSIEPGADLRLVFVISLVALCGLLCICCKMYR